MSRHPRLYPAYTVPSVALLSILTFCQWIENTPLGAGIRDGRYWFPIIETTHTLGIILMAGTISVLDLRLMGYGMRKENVASVAGQILPWTWSGFVLMFFTGALLVCSEAVKLYQSPFFRFKLLLIAMAALNALIFHRTIYTSVSQWGDARNPPLRARLAGILSFAFWIGVIALGRAIGYESGR